MTKHQHTFATTLAIGVVVAVAAFAIRGLAPELYRYIRIRRM